MTYQTRIRPDPGKVLPEAVTVAPDPFGTVFSATERAAIALAYVDGADTLHSPGRRGGYLRKLLFPPMTPSLASPRLEALRRVAVVLRLGRQTVEADEIDAALAAGYSRAKLSALRRHFRPAAPEEREEGTSDQELEPLAIL